MTIRVMGESCHEMLLRWDRSRGEAKREQLCVYELEPNTHL